MNGFVGLVAGLIATVLFLSVNFLANTFLTGTRIDLTEENLFTLSEGARRIAKDLEEPIRLTLYYSSESGRELPGARDYYQRVRDVLEEYERNSDGNIVLETIDPEPFSEEEDEAVAEGISAVPTSPPFYFGLVGSNATDDRQVIPFFGEIGGGSLDFTRKERFLEYDLSRLIYSLANPEKKKIGVLSSLPIEGSPGNPMLQQPQQPAWRFLDQLRYFLDVQVLSPADEALPDDLDGLLVVHPRSLSDTLLYAIDQYVLAGGKLVALVDPHCEVDMTEATPQNRGMGINRSSDLNRLFNAWGFEMVPNRVAGDRANALPVQAQTSTTGGTTDYVAWMDLGSAFLADEDPTTSLLDSVRLIAPGSLRATEGATTTFEPLLTTSDDAMEVDTSMMMFLPDPQRLLDTFVSGGEPLTLMARVSGEVPSAFPDGAPGDAPAEGEQPAEDGTHLAASNGPIHVIAISDADFLYDQWWLQRSLFGMRKVQDNCDLVLNALENLTGGSELLSIRARGKYSRPFDRVEELRKEAERKFRDKEQGLMEKERQIAEEIRQLQSEKDPNDPAAQVFLSPEQVERLEEAQVAQRETRKELREVRLNLDREIEALGLSLKALNILGMPLLVTLFACGLGFWRMMRRGTR